MLESIVTEATATVSLMDCIICIAVAAILGGVISFTHKNIQIKQS